MRLQGITYYLLRHRLLALLLAFGVAFVPVIGIVSILFAGLATLRKGTLEGLWLMIAATMPYLIILHIPGTADASALTVPWAAVGVAVASNVLTWVFAAMLYRHANWSQVLQVAALIGVLMISLVHLAFPEVADWWGIKLMDYYQQAAEALNTKNMPVGSDILEWVSATKIYATGLMVAAVLFNAILQLIVARWWQAIVYSPGMLRRELHGIRLNQLAGLLFVASLILVYVGNGVVLDMMPVLYLLFGAAGLSLMHYMFGLMKSATRWFWLWLMYLTLFFAMPTSWILLSLMALFDIWLDIRRRLKTT